MGCSRVLSRVAEDVRGVEEFGAQGGFGFRGVGFRIWGLGFRVRGFGFWVLGFHWGEGTRRL